MKVFSNESIFLTSILDSIVVKDIVCIDIKIFGTWSHDLVDISILLYINFLLGLLYINLLYRYKLLGINLEIK